MHGRSLSGGEPIPPNVLMIVLDDVGVDKLDFYGLGGPTPPTPSLHSLRQAGLLFTQAYANPVCSPTRAAIQTGRHAFRTGMGHNTDYGYSLPASEVTIPEMLEAGFPGQPDRYRCGAFGKWHLTHTDYMHAIDQGYDVFVGPLGNVDDHYHWRKVEADAQGYDLEWVGSPSGPWDETTFTATVVRKAALEWIMGQSKPFFASVCFNPPHSPYQVPPLSLLCPETRSEIETLGLVAGQDLTQSPLAALAYDWLLEAVDTEIGRLVQGIPLPKLWNTVILVVGDNGTAGAAISDPPFDPSHGKGTAYQLGTRVPLIAVGRLVGSTGGTCTGLVHAVDLWRTVAGLTGARVQVGGGEDSVSFEAMIRDSSGTGLRTQAFVQNFHPSGPYVPDPDNPPPGLVFHDRGMTDGRYKNLRLWELGLQFPTEEAYDLLVDAHETVNLWPSLESLPEDARAAILQLKSSMISLSGY